MARQSSETSRSAWILEASVSLPKMVKGNENIDFGQENSLKNIVKLVRWKGETAGLIANLRSFSKIKQKTGTSGWTYHRTGRWRGLGRGGGLVPAPSIWTPRPRTLTPTGSTRRRPRIGWQELMIAVAIRWSSWRRRVVFACNKKYVKLCQ